MHPLKARTAPPQNQRCTPLHGFYQNDGSLPTKKSLLSTGQKRLFCVMRSLRNVMRTACVMQTSSVMYAFGACGTHRITYHSAATSLITCLQINQICDTISKSEVCMMSESKLRDLSMEFSVDIIELARYLKSIKESIISNQIG